MYGAVQVSVKHAPHCSVLNLLKIAAADVQSYLVLFTVIATGVCITDCDRFYIQIQVCIRCKASVSAVLHVMFALLMIHCKVHC